GDDRDAQAGLHRQRARAGDLRRPHRRTLRSEERDGADARDDRAPLRLDARRHGAGRDRLRLAGDRPLRGELGGVERLPADHGGDAPARPQLHARKLPRRPRVRLARPADARGGRRVMDQALARAPLLAWLERHAPTARELRRYARIFARSASSLLGLALAIVGALGPGIMNAIVALSLVWWPGYVRLVQGKTLSVKTQTFVEAARAVGTGRLRVVFVHILPNCLSPITVKASMDMGTAILAAASLGF